MGDVSEESAEQVTQPEDVGQQEEYAPDVPEDVEEEAETGGSEDGEEEVGAEGSEDAEEPAESTTPVAQDDSEVAPEIEDDEPEPEDGPQPQAEPQPEPEAQPEPEPQPEAEPEPDAQPEVETQADDDETAPDVKTTDNEESEPEAESSGEGDDSEVAPLIEDDEAETSTEDAETPAPDEMPATPYEGDRDVSRALNQNMSHIDDMRAQRAGFADRREAGDAVRDLGRSMKENGIPEGTLQDTSHSDGILVPIGENGYAVYRLNDGVAKFKTILEKRD